MTSISRVRAEVHRELHQLVALVERPSPQTATEVEMALWVGMLRLGMAMMRLFFAHQAARWPSGLRYEVVGVAHEIEGVEDVEVGTKFGKVSMPQPVGRAVGQPRARRDLPMSRALGLPGGFTLPLVTLVAKFSALMAFAPTRQILRDLLGWAPAPRSVLRMVDAIGAAAGGFLEQAAVPEGDTDVLLITVDGKGAPTISSAENAKRRQSHRKGTGGLRQRKSGAPKKRRAPGKKAKNAKMAAVGVICTLKLDESGLSRPVNKRMYATFKNYRALFVWLKAEAVRRGYGTTKFRQVQFVADGADTLWALQQEFFPDAVVCLDWVHAVEKLWKCGKAINRGSEDKRKREPLEVWVHQQKKLLRQGKLNKVLATLQAALDGTAVTGPGNKSRRKVLGDTINHFTKNRARMRYKSLRQQGLVIASGLIEGTVRHLVGMRLDGPGMRWGKARAEAVLHLRCVLLNGLWTDFESYLARRDSLRLASKPAPTVTHDAKAQLKNAA
jgi:hypothetical protein